MRGRWRQPRAAPKTGKEFDKAQAGSRYHVSGNGNQRADECSEDCRPVAVENIVSGLHKDPKTQELFEGPGIVDWGFAAIDGTEGRHHDPWSSRQSGANSLQPNTDAGSEDRKPQIVDAGRNAIPPTY